VHNSTCPAHHALAVLLLKRNRERGCRLGARLAGVPFKHCRSSVGEGAQSALHVLVLVLCEAIPVVPCSALRSVGEEFEVRVSKPVRLRRDQREGGKEGSGVPCRMREVWKRINRRGQMLQGLPAQHCVALVGGCWHAPH